MSKLPPRLRYLRSVLAELLSLPSEEVNENMDTYFLLKLLRERVKGQTLRNAENRLSADYKALEAWMEEDRGNRAGVAFILATMHAFEFELGEGTE